MVPEDPLEGYRIHFEKVLEFCKENGDQCYDEIGKLMDQVEFRLLAKKQKEMKKYFENLE